MGWKVLWVVCVFFLPLLLSPSLFLPFFPLPPSLFFLSSSVLSPPNTRGNRATIGWDLETTCQKKSFLLSWFSWVFCHSEIKMTTKSMALTFPLLVIIHYFVFHKLSPSSLMHPKQSFWFLPWAPPLPLHSQPRLHFTILIFNQNMLSSLNLQLCENYWFTVITQPCLLTSQFHPVRGAAEIFIQTDKSPLYLAELTSMTRGHILLPGDISGVMHSEILPGTQSHCHLFVKINSIKCQPPQDCGEGNAICFL